MPKEVIHGSQPPFGDEDRAVAAVEIRWSRDAEYVQVVSRCLDRSTEEAWHSDERDHLRAVELAAKHHEFRNARTKEAEDANALSVEEGIWLLSYLVDQFGAGLTVHGGFFVDVDRRGINAMIRHLRRARDQAYGVDE